MSERFDDLSKAMAGSTSRRSLIKLLGAAAGTAVAATVVKPFRGYAVDSVVCSGPTTASHIPCAAGTTPCNQCCCKKGIACVDETKSTCGCPAGTTHCGNACCAAGVACKNRTTSTCSGPTSACLQQGQVPCGNICCTPCTAAGQHCHKLSPNCCSGLTCHCTGDGDSLSECTCVSI
jgi:hypothetical protein